MENFSSALAARGILDLVIGGIAVAWPGITIGAFVILSAVYAFMAAGTEEARAFRSGSGVPVVGGVCLAALDIVAGVLALVGPGITALSLVWIIAVWAVVGGFAELARAFTAGESVGERPLLSLLGLLKISLGFVFAVRPDG